MDALIDDMETELSGLDQDSDLAALAGFFQGTATVTPPASVLSPMQLTEPFELPRGVVEWAGGSYAPVEGATPPAPYDYQMIGNASDTGAQLLVDWNAAGDEPVTLAFAGNTIELPTNASAVVKVGTDTVAEATFTASWELVDETRCNATAFSLTATNLEFDVTAGSHAFTVQATTSSDSTSLSVELALGGIGAGLGFTIDEQFRILDEPCLTGLPLDGTIGTPSSAGLDVDVSSGAHSAAVSADFTGIAWNTGIDQATLTAFDLSGRLTIDGSAAGTLEGSFDETASQPFDGSVLFDDGRMTFEEIVNQLAATTP